MISIRSLAILLIVSIAMANSLKLPLLNVAKDEANVKLEQGDALKATNQDTKSTKLEAGVRLLKDPPCCAQWCAGNFFGVDCTVCLCDGL